MNRYFLNEHVGRTACPTCTAFAKIALPGQAVRATYYREL
jgi:hypothetical protein